MDQPPAPRRCFKGSKIAFNDGRSTIDCLVRNDSDRGARLHLPSTTGVPDEFELVFKNGTERRRCRAVWRSLTEMGVAFVS